MSENKTCQRCGAPLGPDAPEGLCPRCLMGLNLSAQTDAPTGEAGPDGTRVVPPPPEPPPLVSDIARHFPQLEILECLGRGGMGVVYKARHSKLDRFVALKILAREKERDPHFAERFQREARALARLNHPNIVAVHDFGETDGLFYLLMEFVDGVNLRQLIRAGKITPEEALAVVPPICEALQYAHKQGIVHRDIKPENILIDKQGGVKIADFGIAKILGTEGGAEPLTAEQQAIGTPHYMAPEQVEKPKTVDHRADIYSLGVVFYEILTGELPLGKFAPPSQKVRIDVRLDEVVLHALEKEPGRRYQQVGEVKTDLETIASTEGPGPGRAAFTPPVISPAPVGTVWRQVKGPAVGLMLTGIASWLAIPLLLLVVSFTDNDIRRRMLQWLVPLAALVVGGLLFLGGLLMKRLGGYWLAVAAGLLAIVTMPGNLIGLPIGIWALVVLSRREVRESFGQGHVLPAVLPAEAGGGWKVAAVVVAAVILVLAVPIGAILLFMGVPALAHARARDAALQAQHRIRAAQSARARYSRSKAPVSSLELARQSLDGTNRPAAELPLLSAQTIETLVTKGIEAGQFGDYKEAFKLFLPAARAGNPIAQHRLGVMYVRGDGVKQDFAEATRWFRKAAEQGQGESQFSLGLRYLEGEAVPRDYKEAARWFKLAADQGVGMAASRLAELYATGRGVPRDFVEAYKWLAIAGSEIEPNVITITLPDLRRKLSSEQAAEAERRAREFVPTRVGPADP